MGIERVRMSTTTRLVLAVLLASGRAYGLELCRGAGLATGTVHPILARLERAGWVTSEWEQLDPHRAGRPARRYYQLTADGADAARAALQAQPLARPAAPGPGPARRPGTLAPGLGLGNLAWGLGLGNLAWGLGLGNLARGLG